MQRAVRAAVPVLLTIASAIHGAAQVSVALNESKTYPAARIGLNQGSQDFYSGYLLKNLVAINPGFEAPAKNVVQNVAVAGTTKTFVATNPWDQAPNNFFAGGTFYVAYGANRGCAGSIASSAAADQKSTGSGFTLATACPHPFQKGDVIFTRVDHFPTSKEDFNFDAFGWQRNENNGGVVAIDSKPGDQFPGSQGKQCVELNTTSGGGATAAVHTGFDTSDTLYYAFRGTFTETIRARVLKGSGLKVTFSGVRLNPAHDGVQWSQSLPLDGSWKTYSIHFFADETPATQAGAVQIDIAVSGKGIVLVDDASLTSNNDNSPTAFRNQVIDDEKSWNPGEGRYWGGQNAETLDNWLKPASDRQGSSGNTGNYRQGAQIQYGLHDWLVKEAYEGVPQVWIELPVTWRDNPDASDIVDYIAGGAGTAFGAKRIELGQKSPWTSVFHRIVLEYGNETWNWGAGGENITPFDANGRQHWAYLDMAVRFCSAMKGNANWNAPIMKCAAGMQSAGAWWTRQLLAADKNRSVDVQANHEYGMMSATQFTGNSQWISAWTEAWSAAHDPHSNFYQTFNAGIQSGIYEFNNSTSYETTITQPQATGYPEGEGYGLVDILMPLFNLKAFGIVDNDFFTLAQREQTIHNKAGQPVTLKEWGAFKGLGGQETNARPMVLAAGMVNGCIGNGMGFDTTVTGGPTYDFSGYNGVPAASNVPYLNFFAFKNGNTRCIVVVNVDPEKSYSFSFTGNNPPSGAVEMQLYTSPRLTDNNEATMTVGLKSSTVQSPHNFEIPPHSAMSISYTVVRNVSMPQPKARAVRASFEAPSGMFPTE